MSMSPWKPGGLPVAEEQARLRCTEAGLSTSARLQRVKVYCLTDEGKWDDQGTGHVTIDYIEGSRELALAVVDEEDNKTLLLHNITSDDIYRKQEETIISWKDPEQSLELALSFQEAAGCSYIWNNMHCIQQSLQCSVLRSQIGPRTAFESREASRESLPNDESLVSVHGELKDLPPLELTSLPLMLKIILEHGTTDKMRVAELIYQDHEFFPKLVNLFRMCEALKNMDALHMIFRLVKGIIFLNNSAIYQKIFSDALILDIIGALEYDPEVNNLQPHRTFLKEQVVFKEVIPIRNASVVSKIHQTYRIAYIKDVILPRALDDVTLASLNAIIQANNALVSRLLKDDPTFIHEVITRMKSSNISAESKSKLVLFLSELCTLSKSLQPFQQLQLSRDLISEGVLDIISDVLQSHDKVVASTGTGILMHFLDQDPNLVITNFPQQDQNCQEGNSLLDILIHGMVTDSGGAMHLQCSQILRTLIDSSRANMATNSTEIAVQIFYEKHFHKLIDVIASSCRPKGITQSVSGSADAAAMVEEHPAKPEILLNICELLCFCVRHKPYRIKLDFFTSNSMEKILTLTQRREKTLVVSAVKFMRTVIGRKDEFLINHVIKFNLLKPIIEAFVENGDRYNMLHSVILEMLEFIRKENIELLIEYVSKFFWDQLVKFERLESIRAFKLKYQQIMERAKTKPSASLIDKRKKGEERVIDKQEEDYFNRASNGEDSPKGAMHEQRQSRFKSADGDGTCHIPARCKLVGLVDCDDLGKKINPPPKIPASSDEDDQIDVKANEKPKLEVRVSCAKIASAANVTDGHSDLEDLRDEIPGSHTEQSTMQSLDSEHHTGEDSTEAGHDSSPKTD